MDSSLLYPYPSRRYTLFAGKGAVCASTALAAQAGLSAMKAGGNAIDAAVATAACLTVLEPQSNGIGGDAFAILTTREGMMGLNASGPSARLSDGDGLRARGLTAMPTHGILPVTVPGAPSAWAALTRRYGRRTLAQNLQYAVDYAREGFIFTPVMEAAFTASARLYGGFVQAGKKEFASWFEEFAPNGEVPKAGTRITRPRQADTLEAIGRTEGEWFYRGEFAQKLEAFSKQWNGWLRADDLRDYQPQWVAPLSVEYEGKRVWELPPNGQGMVALMALNLLKGLELSEKDDPRTWHLAIEAVKLAFADGLATITEPSKMPVKPEELLSEGYADERRRLIGEKAALPMPGSPPSGGTVYLCAADGEGNMISYIQSNYMGFGSGLVVPGTGVALQNRGDSFSLNPAHANCLEPGKRPYHTIIPGFLTEADGTPLGPFGVMGGFMQPQGHTQVIMNMLNFGMNPQAALDCPRFCWEKGKEVWLEDCVPASLAEALRQRGHEISLQPTTAHFGRGQIILRRGEGMECATEPRADGVAATW